MSELRGRVQDIGLLPLVQFLSTQHRSGGLEISEAGWVGELRFAEGRLVDAVVGEERGQRALELIALALGQGDFVYVDRASDAGVHESDSIDLQPEFEHLLSDAQAHAHMPRLLSVPRASGGPGTQLSTQEEVALNRADLALLLELDGQRTVAEVLRGRNSLRTLHTLTRLSDVGIVDLDPPRDRHATNGSTTAPTLDAPLLEGPPPLGAAAQRERVAPDVVAPASRAPGRGFGLLLDGLKVAALTAVFVVAFRSVAQSVHVQGQSMLPSLAEGELLLVDRSAYFQANQTGLAGVLPGVNRYPLGGPRRGDVVVFQSPTAPDTELVKRIVAVPGEEVRIEGGRVLVGDRQLDEPYAQASVAGLDNFPLDEKWVRVPEDSYFVLGDNRSVSVDSRQGWFAPADQLVGRAWLVYWPPSAWRIVPQAAGTLRTVEAPAEPPLADATTPTPVLEASAAPEATPTAQGVESSTGRLPTVEPPTVQPTAVRVPVLLSGSLKDQPGWPTNTIGTAVFDDVSYRLLARLPNRFVAVAAPRVEPISDVIVTGTFHKIGGPPGGGYGIFVRDSATNQRDGLDQSGSFYVAEVGDRGEVGLWLRDTDHWVDLVPWTPSAVVNSGGTTNELTLRAVGQQLAFMVNGTEVARVMDRTLSTGRVGAFVGGDLNEVVVDRFAVETPSAGDSR